MQLIIEYHLTNVHAQVNLKELRKIGTLLRKYYQRQYIDGLCGLDIFEGEFEGMKNIGTLLRKYIEENRLEHC